MSADPSEKIRIECPQCGKPLMVPSSALGKTGKCPGCQHVFPLQAKAAPLPSAAPPVVKKPPLASAPAAPLGNASADPFGGVSGFDQGGQPMAQQPFAAPQSPLGAPQQFGQQPAEGFAPAPGFQQPNPGFQQPNPGFQQPNPALQQPNPSQWASSPSVSTQTTPATRRRKKSSSDNTSAMGAIGGGLLMMIGAAVWFVLGLMADRIFIYPPILFIAGICSLVKGIAELGR